MGRLPIRGQKVRQMNGKHMVFVAVVSAVMVILMASAVVSSAPYWTYQSRSYTYDFWSESASSPLAYEFSRIVTAHDMGVGSLRNPRDIFVRHDRVYIVDSGNNRVVCLGPSLELLWTISEFDNAGVVDRLRNPGGIFVTDEEHIYIADRDNARIVHLDSDGRLVRIIGAPTATVSGILPEGFVYKPEKVVVDPAGRLYVISADAYDGILTLGNDGRFLGFIGAPRVTPSPLEVIWRRISTAEQNQRRELLLPIEYSGISLDSRGMIHAVVAGWTDSASIKRLNPSGYDVLKRKGFAPPQGDLVQPRRDLLSLPGDRTGTSTLVDVLSRAYGNYSVLDNYRGRVFTYDERGNLLYVFGGTGYLAGLFEKPTAIEELGSDMIVLDGNVLVVFSRTAYGNYIHNAIAAYANGLYELSIRFWQAVLTLNANYSQAYSGIGRGYLMSENYVEAMRYFRLGDDRSGYSDAFKEYRREVIAENLGTWVILIGALLLMVYLIARFGGQKIAAAGRQITAKLESNVFVRRSRVLEVLRGLRFSLYVVFHPFDGFEELKRKGNVISATVLLGLVFGAYLVLIQYTGFVFNQRDLRELNIYYEMLSILVPFLLWCVVNWALTTLMDGKGTLRDVYVSSAYAMTPIILVYIPLAFLSNYLTLEEGGIYLLSMVLTLVWAVVLLLIGNMVTHEFSFGGAVGTVVLSILGMAFVLFMILLFFNLFDKLASFISTVLIEASLRWGR